MDLIVGNIYKVKSNHRFHAGRYGVFQGLKGPNKDIAVLSERGQEDVLFACSPTDLVSVEVVEEIP